MAQARDGVFRLGCQANHHADLVINGLAMDTDDLLGTIRLLCPDAEFGESEGRIVILTGVKASLSKPAAMRAEPKSKWCLQPCIKLSDWCAERELNVADVVKVLVDSKISLGSAADVLFREGRLCQILGIEPPAAEDAFMVSIDDRQSSLESPAPAICDSPSPKHL